MQIQLAVFVMVREDTNLGEVYKDNRLLVQSIKTNTTLRYLKHLIIHLSYKLDANKNVRSIDSIILNHLHHTNQRFRQETIDF